LAGWRKQRVKKNKERKSTEADIHKENSRLKKEITELKSANENIVFQGNLFQKLKFLKQV